MRDMMASWVGKAVSVTLRLGGGATAVTLDGTLLQVGVAGCCSNSRGDRRSYRSRASCT
jgi:hypothetical protein